MRMDKKERGYWDAIDFIISGLENCHSTDYSIMNILANSKDLNKEQILFLLGYAMRLNSEEFYEEYKNMKSYKEKGMTE